MAVLGGLMSAGQYEAWDQMGEILAEDDFFSPQHRTVFSAMKRLANRAAPMDRIAVLDELRSHGALGKAGGEDYLEIIEASAVGWRGVRGHAEIVAALATRRRLIHVANRIQALAFEPGDMSPDKLLHNADAELLQIATERLQSNDPINVSTLLSEALEKVERQHASPGVITGAPSGWRDLDRKTSGFQKGDLVVLAARPAMGKTAMALNIAEQLAMVDNPEPVLFFSLEQPREQLALRLISSLVRIDVSKLRTGYYKPEDRVRVSHAANVMSDRPLYFDDTSRASPNYIRTRARRLKHDCSGLALIIVDYLQLMETGGKFESRTLEISSLTKQLKSIARELETPILALSQLNRELERRPDKRPILADLRESGSIEQDADVVMFIYRDEIYNKDSKDKGTAELIVAKHRNGPTGMVTLTFLKELTKFESHSDTEDYEDGYDSLGDAAPDDMH